MTTVLLVCLVGVWLGRKEKDLPYILFIHSSGTYPSPCSCYLLCGICFEEREEKQDSGMHMRQKNICMSMDGAMAWLACCLVCGILVPGFRFTLWFFTLPMGSGMTFQHFVDSHVPCSCVP